MTATKCDAESFWKQLTARTGVYQMYDGAGGLLYVGKAKNLKNRVTSYFRASGLSGKTMALVSRIRDIQVTVTTTERDALLLEHNLIKEYHPPYNILLKDDKSYPYACSEAIVLILSSKLSFLVSKYFLFITFCSLLLQLNLYLPCPKYQMI